MGKSIYSASNYRFYMKNILIAILLISTIVVAGCTTQAGGKTLGDGTIVKQDGTMIKPDGTMILPNGTIITPKGQEHEMMHNDTNGTMMEHGNMTNNGTMMEHEVTYSGTVLAGNSSPLIDFNKADYDAALKTDKLVVLYFYANWCPICRTEVPEMYAAFNELQTDKVIGFRINFNDDRTDQNEINIARQFGVPYQHTKVFVKNNQSILKSSESWNKERYLSEINKALG